MPTKLVLLESYSLLRTLLAAPSVRSADVVYLYAADGSDASGRSWPRLRAKHREAVSWLVRALNARAAVRPVPQEMINRHLWHTNKEIVGVVDGLRASIEESGAYQIARRCVGSPDLIKYYQHRLAGSLPAKLLFWKIALDFSDSHEVTPVPRSGHGLLGQLIPAVLRRSVPRAIAAINAAADVVRNVAASLLLVGFPTIYLGRETLRRGIRLTMPTPVRRRVLQTVIWGIEQDVFNLGVRYNASDTFLVHHELSASDIVYTFRSGPRYTGPKRTESKSAMVRGGFSHVDPLEMRMTPALIRRIAAWQASVVVSSWRLLTKPAHAALPEISYGALYHALQKRKQLDYVDYRVEFCMDDLDPAHIVKSIVSTQQGRRTIGVQHRATAGPFVQPQLCFVHYDVYCAASRAHVRLHAPWWDGLNLAKTGSMWIDRTVNLAEDADHLRELDAKVTAMYGRRTYRALVAFPGTSPLNMAARWDEMYEGLKKFVSTDLDCTLFLRFREADDPHMARFERLAAGDDRIVIDNVNVATYELMTLCDAYITSSDSSGMIEAVAIGKPSFTFDYRGNAGFCYGAYGDDLILRTSRDVVKVFDGIKTGFAGFDCDWDALREDFNYHYDGDCLGRLQRVVVETLREAEADTR